MTLEQSTLQVLHTTLWLFSSTRCSWCSGSNFLFQPLWIWGYFQRVFFLFCSLCRPWLSPCIFSFLFHPWLPFLPDSLSYPQNFIVISLMDFWSRTSSASAWHLGYIFYWKSFTYLYKRHRIIFTLLLLIWPTALLLWSEAVPRCSSETPWSCRCSFRFLSIQTLLCFDKPSHSHFPVCCRFLWLFLRNSNLFEITETLGILQGNKAITF